MIRFDTLNKKPKLWNIAALTGGLALVLAFFLLRGAERFAAADDGQFAAQSDEADRFGLGPVEAQDRIGRRQGGVAAQIHLPAGGEPL